MQDIQSGIEELQKIHVKFVEFVMLAIVLRSNEQLPIQSIPSYLRNLFRDNELHY